MTVQELSEMFKADARKAGLCDEWFNGWGNPGKDSLIQKYKDGIDFQISTHFTTDKFILENFTKDELRAMKVFVDDTYGESRSESGIYIVQGDSECSFRFEDFAFATFHVFGNAKVEITTEDASKVFVNVYEYASAKVVQKDISKAYVYTHGDHCTASSVGDVLFRKSTSLA